MEKFKIIPAVHMFLIRYNKILLSKRFNTGYEDGKYSVPAGHLDGNETVKSAAIRECKEEIGVNVKEENLDVFLVMHRMSEEERVDFFLQVNNWEGEISNKEPEKCSELQWFDIKKLPSNVIPYIREAISKFGTGDRFTSYGWKNKGGLR